MLIVKIYVKRNTIYEKYKSSRKSVRSRYRRSQVIIHRLEKRDRCIKWNANLSALNCRKFSYTQDVWRWVLQSFDLMKL